MVSGCVSGEVYPQEKINGPFKSYDTVLRNTIMQRWHSLLDRGKFAQHKIGKIVLQFHLNYDGSITDIKVLEDGVGDEQVAICQEAVYSSAPFSRWPKDMIRMVGANYRVITYTFNYYK